MKKRFLIIALLLSSFVVFAEGGFNFNVGIDAAASLKFKPFIGANLSFDYSWKNGFGLGVGLKEYYNIIQKKEESTVQGDIIKNIQEPKFLGGLYGFAKYKWFYAGTGSFFVDGLGVLSMYFNIGGAIPFWEMKKGRLGIDFGAEFWMTSEEIEWGYSGAYSSSSEPKNSPLNDLKIYAGVTYFLPL
ncbi:MAG: hypothetical protein J5527_14505 [Treponema sp.]|nr:hypothetical protein [Treponema sp.]